jgi:hypothetical protein
MGFVIGLPVPVSMIATCDQGVVLQAGSKIIVLILKRLKWQPVSDQQTWNVSNHYPLLHKQLTSIKTELSLEQVLQDIHSGVS